MTLQCEVVYTISCRLFLFLDVSIYIYSPSKFVQDNYLYSYVSFCFFCFLFLLGCLHVFKIKIRKQLTPISGVDRHVFQYYLTFWSPHWFPCQHGQFGKRTYLFCFFLFSSINNRQKCFDFRWLDCYSINFIHGIKSLVWKHNLQCI